MARYATDIIVLVDESGRVVEVCPRATPALGHDLTELVGHNVVDYVHPDDREKFVEAMSATASGNRVQETVALRMQAAGGGWHDLEASLTSVQDDPAVTGVLLVARDVTRQKRDEDRVRASERRFGKIAQRSSQVLSIYDAQGRCIFVHDSLHPIAGWGQELVGHSPIDPEINLIPPDQLAATTEWFGSVLARPGEHEPTVFRIRHGDGSEFYAEVVATNLLSDPDVGGIVVLARDVTERHLLEESLRHQALHDHLTGLPNRALFMDRLGQALARTLRNVSRPLVTVFVFELDQFNLVVDSLGHGISDQLLVEAGRVLARAVRPADTVARLSDDAFSVCCENLRDEGEVLATAERLADGLRERIVAHDREFRVTASIGIAIGRGEPGVTPESLIRDADVAVSRAKERGGDRHEVFDETARLRSLERLQLESDLRAALRLGELRFYYQPTIRLDDGRVVGAEALVRWQHPTRGLMLPGQFIPVAEDTGLVVPLGVSVIEEACRQVGVWRSEPDRNDWTVAVNVSGRQLTDGALLDVVQRALSTWDVPPEALCLEITESALMADPDEAASTLGPCTTSASSWPSTTSAPGTRVSRTCAVSPSTL